MRTISLLPRSEIEDIIKREEVGDYVSNKQVVLEAVRSRLGSATFFTYLPSNSGGRGQVRVLRHRLPAHARSDPRRDVALGIARAHRHITITVSSY